MSSNPAKIPLHKNTQPYFLVHDVLTFNFPHKWNSHEWVIICNECKINLCQICPFLISERRVKGQKSRIITYPHISINEVFEAAFAMAMVCLCLSLHVPRLSLLQKWDVWFLVASDRRVVLLVEHHPFNSWETTLEGGAEQFCRSTLAWQSQGSLRWTTLAVCTLDFLLTAACKPLAARPCSGVLLRRS